MKNRKNIIITIFILLVISSCISGFHRTEEFNKTIAVSIKKVLEDEDQLNEMINGNKKDKIKITFNHFKQEVDSSIQKANALRPKSSELILKKSAIDLLMLYKSFCQEEYKDVVRIACLPDSSFTKSDNAIMLSFSKYINQHLDSVLTIFVKNEKDFCEKNDISPSGLINRNEADFH